VTCALKKIEIGVGGRERKRKGESESESERKRERESANERERDCKKVLRIRGVTCVVKKAEIGVRKEESKRERERERERESERESEREKERERERKRPCKNVLRTGGVTCALKNAEIDGREKERERGTHTSSECITYRMCHMCPRRERSRR